MANQILDRRTIAIPGGKGETGDVTPEAEAARDAAVAAQTSAEVARDEAEVFAGATVELQDSAVSTLVGTPSQTSAAIEAATRNGLSPSARASRWVTGRMLSGFQSGHGWKVESGTATVADDVSVHATGAQSLRITTGGDSVRSVIAGAAFPASDPVDLVANYVKIVFRVDKWANVRADSLGIRFGLNLSTRFRERSFAPLAEVTDFGSRPTTPDLLGGDGEWQTTLVSASIVNGERFGSDFSLKDNTRLAIVVQDNGSPVNVWIDEISLVPRTVWPTGVVSFTFDDGYANQYTNAAPVLSKYGFTGTAYVIRDLIDDESNTNYMSHTQVKALQDVFGWEIAAHADLVAHHNADRGFYSLTDAELADDLAKQKRWMIDHGYKGADFSAYPQGWYGQRTIDIAKQFLTSVRTTQKADGLETLPPDDPYRVRCITLTDDLGFAHAKEVIDAAYAFGDWVVFYTHQVSNPVAPGVSCSPELLDQVAAYCAQKRIPVRTYGDVITGVDAPLRTTEPPQFTPNPSEFGLRGWAFDPILATDTVSIPSGGTMVGVRVYANPGERLASIGIHLTGSPGGISVGRFAIYDSSGARIRNGGDEKSQFATTGAKSVTMPVFTVPDDGVCIVGILVDGSTVPQFYGLSTSPVASFGFPSAGRAARCFTFGSGLTDAPTSIDLSSVNARVQVPWVAVGS